MDELTLKVRHTDPLEYSTDGYLHPTTGDNLSEEAKDEAIWTKAGEDVLDQFRGEQPLRIGNVAVTPAGNLPVSHVVHFPVQTAPDVPTTQENIQVGLRSGLVALDELECEETVLPCPVPESSREHIDLEELARTLTTDLKQYLPQHLQTIYCLDTDERWITSLKESIN
ncbi:MAG: macro domain-containing protein [bacterium]